jgi:hypothetical protein
MSEVITNHKCEVTNYICPDCKQPCMWARTAKRGTFDENITSLTYDHTCSCMKVDDTTAEDGSLTQSAVPIISDLDKIYPIVKIKEEVSPIITLS